MVSRDQWHQARPHSRVTLMELGNWWPSQESSKQSTWRHWALPINKHSQYKQNLPDHVSHRGWSWPCNGNTRIQSDNVSNGTEKLKKQISQGFPSLVLCIVEAVAGCGPCTVSWGWPLAPPPHVISLHSLQASPALALHCSPLIKRLLPGATLKC